MTNTIDCLFCFQDETIDSKTLKDTSHSSIDDLDIEDLYVKLKVKPLIFILTA